MKRRAIYIFLPLIAVLLTTIQAAPFIPDISLPSDQGGASSFNQGDASSFNQRDESSFNPINVSHIKHVMPGLPNPAATYCVNHGGSLRYVETPEGTVGYCDLPDGTTCEEWAFYNGECGPSNNPNPTPKSTCDNKILIQGKVTSIDQYRDFSIYVDEVLQGYGLAGTYPGFKLVPGVTVETTPVASSSASINVGDCVEVSGKWCTTDSPPVYLGDTGTYVKKITCSSSHEPSVNPKSKSCIQSGGNVVTKICCKSISDFPNMCAIGACGCSPDDGKEITVCDCGEGKCFDGTSCVDIQGPTPPSCTPGPTGNCKCLNGEIWNEYQNEDCTTEWRVAEDCKNRGSDWSCENCECVETPKTPCDEDECSKQNQPIGNPYFDKCGNKVQLYSVCECRNDKCDCSGREEKTITKRKNRQPNQPLLLGPDGKTTSQGGQKGVPIAFSVSAKDPDGDMVRYKVNWGDGPTSESGPVASGTSWSVSHIWRSSKNYKVEAIAIDQCDEESSSSCYIDIIIV